MRKAWITGVALAVVLVGITVPVAAKQYSDWSAAEKLADISSGSIDSCPCITKDGLSLYFASSRPALGSAPRDLYVSQRTSLGDPWGAPQKLGANINTPTGDERCPYVTPDGRRLIFIRGTATGDDFFASVRQDKKDDFGWGDPVKIDALNSPGMETAAWGFEDEDGKLTLYFGSSRNNPGSPLQLDIFQAIMDSDGNFTPPVLVSELSDPVAYDAFPVVRKDGLELYLTSNRSGGLGDFDIWVSTRNSTSEAWSTPVNLGTAVNSKAKEMRAALTWDGMNMVFASTRDGTWDLYKSQRTKVTGQDK